MRPRVCGTAYEGGLARTGTAQDERQTGQKPAANRNASTLFVAQYAARKPPPRLIRARVHYRITKTRTVSANPPRAPSPPDPSANRRRPEPDPPASMATRERQAQAAASKAERSAALQTLTGEPLPLPTVRRTTPAAFTGDLPGEIVELGANGLTETQIADHLAMDAETLAGMGKAHPELRAALSRARTAAKAWWEEQARRALITENNRFPAGAWAQVMKARFPDYDDRPSITVDLGSLVIIQRAEPLGERAAVAPNPLIEGQAVRPAPSLTGEGMTEPSLSRDDTAADPLAGGEA
jgi:hypothetical protein